VTDLPRRVLAIGAHPDDLEILCAGTMALYAAAGSKVILCNATSGNRGSATLTMEETARLRDQEAGASAGLIGAEYVCLGFDDGELEGASLDARRRFVDLIREWKPDVVFTHHPNDYHADHVAAGKLAFEATFFAGVPLLQTEHPAGVGILPVFYMDTLAGIGFEPEQYVDISSVFATKREMLSQHQSQVTWMKDHDGLNILDFMETMSKFRGIQAGVRYAEAFQPAHAWLRERAARLLP
jgi:LmbE family N-acetylglucosaminyl deacetylase